jgi:hypothetical protein
MSISFQGVFAADNRTALANAFGPFVDGLKEKSYGRSEFVEAQVTMLNETCRAGARCGCALQAGRVRIGTGSN